MRTKRITRQWAKITYYKNHCFDLNAKACIEWTGFSKFTDEEIQSASCPVKCFPVVCTCFHHNWRIYILSCRQHFSFVKITSFALIECWVASTNQSSTIIILDKSAGTLVSKGPKKTSSLADSTWAADMFGSWTTCTCKPGNSERGTWKWSWGSLRCATICCNVDGCLLSFACNISDRSEIDVKYIFYCCLIAANFAFGIKCFIFPQWSIVHHP